MNKDLNIHSNRVFNTQIIMTEEPISKTLPNIILNSLDKNTKHYIITDTNVDDLYGECVVDFFNQNEINVQKLVIPPNELSKSLVRYVELLDEIFKNGLNKKSYIISLGGGVVNNIAGFLASTIYRGIGLMHIATSALSQVDAAIDFKQAVNAKYGKNLVGSFYPADYVIIDPSTLTSLDDRHLYNGLAESLKHALTQDIDLCNQFLEFPCTRPDKTQLTKIVRKTIELKCSVMNDNDPDYFEEMTKQYGHAFGHVIEHLSNGNLYHGEGIAIGMCISAEVSELMGYAPKKLTDAHYAICKKLHLPTTIPDYISNESIFETLIYDKHYIAPHSYVMLLSDFGKPVSLNGSFAIPVEEKVLLEAIQRNRARVNNE